MKELVERVLELNKPENPGHVNYLIEQLAVMKENGQSVSIKSLEAVLDHFKREERSIRTEDLLEWMQENEQYSFEMEDCKVSTRTFVSAKMEDAEKGFQWLMDRGYGDLIKDTLDFPKGELTPEIETFLQEKEVSFVKKSGIHPQTLKKVISDRLEAGDDLPENEDGMRINYFDECVVKSK